MLLNVFYLYYRFENKNLLGLNVIGWLYNRKEIFNFNDMYKSIFNFIIVFYGKIFDKIVFLRKDRF